MQQKPLKYVVKYVDSLKYVTSQKIIFSFIYNLSTQSLIFSMHNTQLESFPYVLGSLIIFYLIECVFLVEKDPSTTQDVCHQWVF
jgi:hypothetical protein